MTGSPSRGSSARTNGDGRRSETPRDRLLLASRPVLLALHVIPRWVLIGVFSALLLLGLFGPQWPAVVALAVLVLVLGWVLALQGVSNGRFPAPLRIALLAALVVILLLRATGHG
jgi:hypothetical protein